MTRPDSLRVGPRRVRERLAEDVRTRNGAIFAGGAVLAAFAPFLVGGYTLDLVMQLLIAVLVVCSWIFVAGYFGIFSFAHAALYGIGAYAAVILAGEAGVNPVLAVFLGGVVAGLASLPIAYPVLRLTGAYVGMVTLAFAEIVYLLAIVFRDLTGGPTGYTNFPPMFGGDRLVLYYFVLVLVGTLLLVQYGLLVNRFGLVARAIREAPGAAQMLGNNAPRYKLAGFLIGSSIAGVAGGLQAHTVFIISPPMFEVEQMIEFMAMGIIGGFRTFGGGIFGAVVVFGLSEGLRQIGELRLVIWGAMLVIVTVYFPEGIAGSSFDLRARLEELLDR